MNKVKVFLYSLIDFFTFYKGLPRKMNGFTIRFPARWSRYYQNGYEAETFDFFKKNIKQGNTILDIGAHIGLYAVPFSRLVGENGKVFCFEPTRSTYKILAKTIALNKCANVVPVNAAISDKSGVVVFNLTTGTGEGSNANTMVAIKGSVTSVEIKAFSIDDFRRQNKLKIDLLKIDVEGAEWLAIKGAKETFEQDRPAGILALHPSSIKEFGHSLENIWQCLESYNLSITYKGAPVQKEFFCAQPDLFDVEFISKK